MNTKHFLLLFLLIFSANSAFGKALQSSDEETDAKIEKLANQIDYLATKIEVLAETQKECQANCQSKIASVEAKNAEQDASIVACEYRCNYLEADNAEQKAINAILNDRIEALEKEIEELKKEATSARSTTMNIEEDDSTYSLDGLKVNNIQRQGVYIRNGQKVVLK